MAGFILGDTGFKICGADAVEIKTGEPAAVVSCSIAI